MELGNEDAVIQLSHNPTASNYFDSVHNLVHTLQTYINVFRNYVPELYEVHQKGLCKSEIVDKTAVFLLSEGDSILIDRCRRFAVDSEHLVERKYKEVSEYLHGIGRIGVLDKIEISKDLMAYFLDYQQRIDWDLLSSGHYGSHVHDGSDIYDVIGYSDRKEDELEHINFNTIRAFSYKDIVELIDFGYRESHATFTKLCRILTHGYSLYASLIIVHVYIDILLMMAYIVGYVFGASDIDASTLPTIDDYLK